MREVPVRAAPVEARVPGLDLARLAAALMVMAMHYLWEGTAKDRHSLAFGAIF